MKTFNFRWLSIILCTALCITFIACENNTPVSSSSSSGGGNSGGTKRDSTNNGEGEEDELVGVITLRLTNDNIIGGGSNYEPNTGIEGKIEFPNGNYSIYLYMNTANNFEVTFHFNELYQHAGKEGWGNNVIRGEFVDMGERPMNKVKSLPSNGWVEKAAILLKHSYIFKYKGEFQFVEYDSNHNLTGYEESYEAEYYKKVYVLEWILNKDQEIIGATVQYVDWDPNPSNKDSEQQ